MDTPGYCPERKWYCAICKSGSIYSMPVYLVFSKDLHDRVTIQHVNATTDGPSSSVGIPSQYNSHQQVMHNGPERSIEGVMSVERNDAGKSE